jgi:iron complex transport system substrate-binding protein
MPSLASVLLLVATLAPPARVISLSPSVTEILDGVGAFDRVVAVSSYCEYPPEVESLPRVGGWTDTNLEQVLGLAPDLVVLTDAQAPLIESKLRALGLETLVVGSQSLEDIFEAVESIGEAVGNREQAMRLSESMRVGLQEVVVAVEGLPRPDVLVVVDRLPGTLRDIYVATEGSYLVDLVRIAGGRPITPEAPMNYAALGKEALVAYDPEVIFDMVMALTTPVAVAGAHELGEDPEAVWATMKLRAVTGHRVYPILDRRLVHPSQFAVETARELARRIHPEAFE